MAMPSGNVVISDKMQFPSGGGGDRQWFPDERDGFISWLRGEFAAANAIIDSLCHHLRAVGEPGEYDIVIGYVQQRRCNWNGVLHMQQYFSVGEVVAALQHVAMKRQQQRFFEHNKFVGNKEFKRYGGGMGFKPRTEVVKDVQNLGSESHGFDGNSSGGDVGKVVVEEEEEEEEEDEEDKGLAVVEDQKGNLWGLCW